MPTMRIEVQDGEIRDAFRRLQEAGENPRPALDAIGNALRQAIYLRIRSGGPAPDGTGWAPLSPVTLAMRRKGYSAGSKMGRAQAALRERYNIAPPSAHPLWSSGALANSIHHQVEGNSVVVGTNLSYARMQQFGARKGQCGTGRQRKRNRTFPIPFGNVPARPFLGLSAEDRAEIGDILRGRIERAIAGR